MAKRFHRALFAALLACVAGLAHAQGFKCKQPDGSTSYQDHACAAGSASSTVATDMSGFDIGSLPGYNNLDSSCQASAKHTVSVCVPQLDATLKRCYQSRLSAHCYVSMTGGTGVHRDPVCVQQATPCLRDGIGEATRCIVQQLPPTCQQQLGGRR
ncbi:hypothetical protein [Scleromatobacter humisilvae]|uniref:DUF4124 domain-containing protein n=1 Tax=Scleromatobacter humisilvae TaxID=2897159 RepID=A0A9X2C2C3_9BURK|nr:hypothetical protein [Scleromatobacter humisilvae]MCK9689147.1 DUF4124 domain-containing protein [Scleromatobacter humisilvae]